MVKILVVVFCLLLAWIINPQQSLGADRVRFAYPAKSLNYLPITMGRDKGIFQAEGIDLQMVLVASTIQVTALTTGDIDFSGAQSQVMAGAARGLPVKVIGFLTIKPSFWLMARPEIKAVAELKSKIIGITAIGSSTDTLARYVLAKNGLAPDREVALIGTGTTSNILTAMKAGTIDAGVLSPPFNAMATQMGYRTLAYFGDYVEQSLSGLGTSDKTDPRAVGARAQNADRDDQELALHSATAGGVDRNSSAKSGASIRLRPTSFTNPCCRLFPRTAAWMKKAFATGSSARPSAWRSKRRRRYRACWICGCFAKCRKTLNKSFQRFNVQSELRSSFDVIGTVIVVKL